MKPQASIPSEGFLHLPQKQKFKAALFLEGRVIEIENAALAAAPAGTSRISLLPDSHVSAGEPFSEWSRFATWDIAASLERLRQYQPTPLDLEVDLQEEVVFSGWQLASPKPDRRDQQFVYELNYRGLAVELVVSAGKESQSLREYLKKSYKKKDRPPLFGLMHYSMGRPVVEPLSVFEEGGLKHLHISNEKINQKALLQAIQFT